MAPSLIPHLVLVFVLVSLTNGLGPPAPGFYPSAKIPTIGFSQGYKNLWGGQHQKLDKAGLLTIWLDKTTGSGFKSLNPYRSGYFSAAIKLQPGYTAGVVTTFYLSNNEAHPGFHDEVDIEFLGTIPSEPYTLQTNVYMKGSGDGKISIGREMKIHLWFDPTKDFHNYAVLWNPNEIIWFVDDIPIRIYAKKSDATFPQRQMWMYGSIWDGSSWATDGGKYKVDYKYQPFISRYNNFKLTACKPTGPPSCQPPRGSPSGTSGLSPRQNAAMQWVQKNYMTYYYCKDPNRNRKMTSECD